MFGPFHLYMLQQERYDAPSDADAEIGHNVILSFHHPVKRRTLFSSKLDSEPLSHALAEIEKQQGRRTQRQAQKCKYADAPAIPGGFEQTGGAEREDAADDTSEDGTGGDGGRGVLLEGVDVVVLTGV